MKMIEELWHGKNIQILGCNQTFIHCVVPCSSEHVLGKTAIDSNFEMIA
jgi:hypothetical protein